MVDPAEGGEVAPDPAGIKTVAPEIGGREARQILVKCPSKYEEEEPPQQNNHVFLVGVGVALVAVAYLGVTMFWKRG